MYLSFFLSDKKFERTRTVYDIVALIAEVSGFADIFMVVCTALLGFFHHPKMYETALLQHIDTKVTIRKNKSSEDRQAGISLKRTIDTALLKSLIYEFKSRLALRLNLWLTLWARYLPRQYRSAQTNLVLSLADKTLARIEQRLDIRSFL